MSQEIKICSDASGCFIGGLSAADTIASDTKMKAPCFIKDGGSSSQFLKADGSSDSNSYTTCIGTVVASDISSFTSCQGDVTGIDAGTAITVTDGTTATPQVAVTSACNTAWNSAKSIADGLTSCAGLACVGDVTGITAGSLIDIDNGTSASPTVNVDLGELVDMTAAINTGQDELVLLDNGAQRRKLFSEVFGSNAYNSTTIPTNTNQLTNGAGFTTCTGTVVAGDLTGLDQSACPGLDCVGDITGINTVAGLSGGVFAGTATLGIDSGTLTPFDQSSCPGLDCVGDITGVAAGSGLTGGGNSGSVTLNIGAGNLIDVAADTVSVDLSELTDGTAAIVPTSDEVVYLDAGSQKRKLFSEIFGSNAYNSTTIPTNTNQLTNGAGFTTCVGDVTGIDAGTAITVTDGTTATPQVAVTSSCNTAWNSAKSIADGLAGCAGLACVGTVTGLTAGTVGIDVGTGATPSVSLDLSELTDMTAAINTGQDELILLDNGAERRKLFSEIFGSNAYNSTTIPTNTNQLTNGAGFTTCTGTLVAGDISGLTSCVGDVTGIDAGTAITITDGTTATPQVAVTGACNTAWNSAKTLADGLTLCPGLACVGTVVSTDLDNLDQSACAGLNCVGNVVSSDLDDLNDLIGCPGLDCVGDVTGVTAGLLLSGGGASGSVTLGLDSGALAGLDQSSCAGILCTGTTTPSNTQTFTNKSGNISQWTNNSGYTTCTGDITGVTAGLLLSGGGASGSVTLGLDSGALEGYASGFVGGNGISLDASDMTEVEVNVDSTVVRTTGNQLIGGIKCFSSNMCTVGDFCAQSRILSGGVDLFDIFCDEAGGGGTTYTGGCGITVFGTLISGCYDSDFQQKVTTNCGSVCLGKCAGKNITEGSGLNNISIGACAACSVTTGDGNISLGKCAGRANVSQTGNVAIGDSALLGNTGGSGNTAIGACAGKCVQGSSNLLFGENAGQGMDSMTDSVAIGRNAMCGSTTIANNDGDRNVAIGMDAMMSVCTGEENVAIGPNAGRPLSTGTSNVFIGACAAGCFTGTPRAITGARNVGLGEAVMYQLGNGTNNFAVGFTALGCNQNGSDNVALGLCAGKRYGSTSAMTTVCDSIFIGPDTKGAASSQTNTIVIGANAVGCGNNTAMIGASNLTVVCSHGSFSTVSDERDKTCICDLEHGLCFIGDLKPKTFNMVTDRDDKEGSISCKRHGFIAQDVIALEGDDNVIINNDNPNRLGYTGEYIIPILVKGMQEQQAIIEDLKERLEVLEG